MLSFMQRAKENVHISVQKGIWYKYARDGDWLEGWVGQGRVGDKV